MYNIAHKVWTGSDMTLSCALVPSRYTSDLKIKSRSPKLEQKCKAQWKLYKVWKNSPRAEEGRKKLNVKVFCYWRPCETNPYIDCHDLLSPPPPPPFFFFFFFPSFFFSKRVKVDHVLFSSSSSIAASNIWSHAMATVFCTYPYRAI